MRWRRCWCGPRNTEKTSAVLGKSEGSEAGAGTQPETNDSPPPGHGRNGAEAFVSSRKIAIAHPKLKHGDRCSDCGKGNVYGQKEPKVLVRIMGRRRWRPPSTRWNGCAAVRCSLEKLCLITQCNFREQDAGKAPKACGLSSEAPEHCAPLQQ